MTSTIHPTGYLRPTLRLRPAARTDPSISPSTSRLSRGFFLSSTTFASYRERRKDPSVTRSRYSSSNLRHIFLPGTWLGRRAAGKAKRRWIDAWTQRNGRGPPEDAASRGMGLLLYIDDALKEPKTVIAPNALILAREDPLGRHLWKVANSVSWRERFCWIRWDTYTLVALYSFVFTCYFSLGERVPVTGRWQCRFLPLQSPPPKGSHYQIIVNDEGAKTLLGDHKPQVKRIQSILDRILLASGLGHLEWKLVVFDSPGAPYAYVTPRSVAVVSSGLFAAAETDDEMAAVLGLGHEVAHVLAHHSEAHTCGFLLGSLALLPAAPFILAGLLIEEFALIAAPPVIVGAAIFFAFCRKREAEADLIAMLLMTEAEYDPRAAVSVWEKMVTVEQKIQREQGVKQPVEYMSTHPHSATRLTQAAMDVPRILYVTGRGRLPPFSSSREIRKLDAFKQRWTDFLEQRVQTSP